jgi:predicted small secreted protein
MKKAILYLGSALVLLAVAGCNTVAGFGEDLNAAGRGLKNTAENSKPKS